MAAIKSSQRPSISSAYRFSLALIAYYDSIAVRTMRRDTAGRSLKAANVITSIRRVELKLAFAINRLFARTRSKANKYLSARSAISSLKIGRIYASTTMTTTTTTTTTTIVTRLNTFDFTWVFFLGTLSIMPRRHLCSSPIIQNVLRISGCASRISS